MLKELEKRLRDEPDNLGLRVALAGAFVEADRRDDAVELYRSVAIAYREHGRTHQAIAVCRSVLELAPGDASSHALLAAMLAEQAAMPEPEPVVMAPPPPPRAKPRSRGPVQGPLAALGATAPDAPASPYAWSERPGTEPPVVAKLPPPEPPPLLLPDDELDDANGVDDRRMEPPDTGDLDELMAQIAETADSGERAAIAQPRIPTYRPSTHDITPLPTPVPYHVAEPTIPPEAPLSTQPQASMRTVPKVTYHDLPPSLRAQMPDELAHVAKLEGIAKAAHQISASLLANRTHDEGDEGHHPVEETGEPIDDEDLLDASELTGVGDFTIANDLDDDLDDELANDHGDSGVVQGAIDGDGENADETHRRPRLEDPHAALDRLDRKSVV